jgi:hypothetical protein
MRVHVESGKVVLHQRDGGSMVDAVADYPNGVHVNGHESGRAIEIGVTRGTSSATSGSLVIDYPASTRVEVRDDTGDIALALTPDYSPAVAAHSAHLRIEGALHIARDDAQASIVLQAPAGTITVTSP